MTPDDCVSHVDNIFGDVHATTVHKPLDEMTKVKEPTFSQLISILVTNTWLM